MWISMKKINTNYSGPWLCIPLFATKHLTVFCAKHLGKFFSIIHLAYSTFPLEFYIADILKSYILALSSDHGLSWLWERTSSFKRKENYSLGCTLSLKLLKHNITCFWFNKWDVQSYLFEFSDMLTWESNLLKTPQLSWFRMTTH